MVQKSASANQVIQNGFSLFAIDVVATHQVTEHSFGFILVAGPYLREEAEDKVIPRAGLGRA